MKAVGGIAKVIEANLRQIGSVPQMWAATFLGHAAFAWFDARFPEADGPANAFLEALLTRWAVHAAKDVDGGDCLVYPLLDTDTGAGTTGGDGERGGVLPVNLKVGGCGWASLVCLHANLDDLSSGPGRVMEAVERWVVENGGSS